MFTVLTYIFIFKVLFCFQTVSAEAMMDESEYYDAERLEIERNNYSVSFEYCDITGNYYDLNSLYNIPKYIKKEKEFSMGFVYLAVRDFDLVWPIMTDFENITILSSFQSPKHSHYFSNKLESGIFKDLRLALNYGAELRLNQTNRHLILQELYNDSGRLYSVRRQPYFDNYLPIQILNATTLPALNLIFGVQNYSASEILKYRLPSYQFNSRHFRHKAIVVLRHCNQSIENFIHLADEGLCRIIKSAFGLYNLIKGGKKKRFFSHIPIYRSRNNKIKVVYKANYRIRIRGKAVREIQLFTWQQVNNLKQLGLRSKDIKGNYKLKVKNVSRGDLLKIYSLDLHHGKFLKVEEQINGNVEISQHDSHYGKSEEHGNTVGVNYNEYLVYHIIFITKNVKNSIQHKHLSYSHHQPLSLSSNIRRC